MRHDFLFVENVRKRQMMREKCNKRYDEVKTVKGFCYLGDMLNASGGCETAVTARTRLEWKKFIECGEILFGKRFSLRMKGKIYSIRAM